VWRPKSLSPPITAYDSTWASFSPQMLPQPPSQLKEPSLELHLSPLLLPQSFSFAVYKTTKQFLSFWKIVFLYQETESVETENTLDRDTKLYRPIPYGPDYSVIQESFPPSLFLHGTRRGESLVCFRWFMLMFVLYWNKLECDYSPSCYIWALNCSSFPSPSGIEINAN